MPLKNSIGNKSLVDFGDFAEIIVILYYYLNEFLKKNITMSFVAGLFIVLTIILTAIHCFLKYSRKGRYLDKVPGPYAYPIIGNAPQFMGSRRKKLNQTFLVC